MDCVSALLSFPQVQDQPDNDGRTALMWAAQRGNYNVLKTLLERDGDVHACDKLGATGGWVGEHVSVCYVWGGGAVEGVSSTHSQYVTHTPSHATHTHILCSRGAQYVDCDRPVDRKGIIGRSHGI